MNMRRYYHLLTLRRSKSILMSHCRWVHQTSHVESHHLYRHPQPPLPSQSIFSSYVHTYRKTYSRNAIGSLIFFQSSHSSVNPNHYGSQVSTIHKLELPIYENNSRHDYPVTVKGREVISAAVTPVNKHWLPLSNLDLLLPPIEAGVFFCYKKKNNTDMSTQKVVDTIKKSLAGILPTFYPLAGKIVQNSHGEPEVVCNNSGVEFVHAHADLELKDLDFYHPDRSVKGKLVPKLNSNLLSVQVTELKCGSMIISCAFNHQLTDGYSMSMFLVAWAKHAHFNKMSNIPSFRPSMLNPRHPPHYEKSLDNLYIPITSLPPPSSFEEPLESRMYYVRAESIQHIQSEASTKETKRSKLLSFTAYIWKLLADGNNDVANTVSRMGVVVNGRRFLTEDKEKSSSPFKNHYGNVLSVPYGVGANSDLKAMPLHEVANRVHEFVAETTNEEHFRGLIDWVELHRPAQAVARIYFGHEKSGGRAVVVSSGQGLPINDMDFGWGKPEFGSYHVPWGSRTGYITTMPSASGNGDWVVYMHLNEKEFDVIERMAPNMFTPLSISTLV